MGLFIENIGNTKQETLDWLSDNAWFKRLSHNEEVNFDFEHHAKKGRRLICVVDNGTYVTVGVAFDKRELEKFLIPDGRVKAWYTMNIGTIEIYAKFRFSQEL